jgi:hypothetical protein
MSRDLLLENPKTGAVRPFRDGFDWVLFLLSPALGIPLFWQGLPMWGATFFGLWVAGIGLHYVLPVQLFTVASAVLALVCFCLQLWLGVRGRELVLRAYIARGWRRRERATPKPRRARKQPP